MALHFPLVDNEDTTAGLARPNYTKDYPFVNVASADLVVFHCLLSSFRGPAVCMRYRQKLLAGELLADNKKQKVAILQGGFKEVQRRATDMGKDRIEGLDGYRKL